MGDGAFSNVYKAVERKTGQKVAVKVVRKYELNSSQVRPVLSQNPSVSIFVVFNVVALGCLPHPGQVRGQGSQGLVCFDPNPLHISAFGSTCIVPHTNLGGSMGISI